MAWAGNTDGPKLVVCCYILLLCCSSELLLEVFLAMEGFLGSGFRMVFVFACEGNSVEFVEWLKAV